MNDLPTWVASGWGGYALILFAGMLATEPWRWLGVRLSRDLSVDSEVFRWVRAVSTAMVAGLVARLLTFPLGQLEAVPLSVRLGAFVAGVLFFVFVWRSLAIAVAGSAVLLVAAAYLVSA